MLCLEADGRTTWEGAAVGAFVAIQEITGVELQTWFGGINLHGASALGLCQLGGKAQFTLFLLVQYIVMVETVTELNLLVVSFDILTESLCLAEIERSSFNLQDFTCWNGRCVGGQIEVCIDFANLALDAGSGIGSTAQCKEGVVCQVDNRLLVSGSQILNNQLVLVGEGKFYRYVQFASETFLTIR